MLTFLKERLSGRLAEIPRLADAYQARDARYRDLVLEWLRETESELARLRSPLVGMVGAQRTMVLAVDDGLLPPAVESSDRSRRQARRAAAALAVSNVESILRARVEEAEGRLMEANAKLAQLVAVSSSVEPIPMPPSEPRELWLDRVWRGLGVDQETKRMRNYVAALVTAADRRHLLDTILENLLAGVERDAGS